MIPSHCKLWKIVIWQFFYLEQHIIPLLKVLNTKSIALIKFTKVTRTQNHCKAILWSKIWVLRAHIITLKVLQCIFKIVCLRRKFQMSNYVSLQLKGLSNCQVSKFKVWKMELLGQNLVQIYLMNFRLKLKMSTSFQIPNFDNWQLWNPLTCKDAQCSSFETAIFFQKHTTWNSWRVQILGQREIVPFEISY